MPAKRTGREIPCALCQSPVWVAPGKERAQSLFFCSAEHTKEYRRRFGGTTLGRPCSETTKRKLRKINTTTEAIALRRGLARERWAKGFQGSTGRPHTEAEKSKAVATRRARGSYKHNADTIARLTELNRAPERRELSREMAKQNLAPIARSKEGRERGRRAAINLLRSPERRSKLEARFKAWLESKGWGFQEQFTLPGAPEFLWDFAIPSKRILIEVDGCYWHGCEACGFEGVPKTVALDKRKSKAAEKSGWTLMRMKECTLNRTI